MKNSNNGSAVAIVLMILAVVSLIGVGLLMQSKMDVRLTSAIRSHDRLFSLADGAASIGYKDVSTFTHDIPVPPSGVNPLEDPVTYEQYFYWIRTKEGITPPLKDTAGSDTIWLENVVVELPSARQPPGVPTEAQEGFQATEDFSVATVMLGYNSDPTDLAGYEIAGGQFAHSYLMVEGTARRRDNFVSWAMRDPSDSEVEHKIHAACLKLIQK
jgi:hypothetical protein